MRIILGIGIVLLCFRSLASDREIMRIGIYRDVNLTKIKLSYLDGEYDVLPDTMDMQPLLANQWIQISSVSGKCRLLMSGGKSFNCDTVRLKRRVYEAGFVIKPVSPGYRERKYVGDLLVTVDKNNYLKIINEVPLYYYLAGVIESEAGAYQSLEYYKVQAIISRTYALRNKDKHMFEGFMLTDLVNCQVYKSMCRYDRKIYDAVAQTDGLVIINSDLELITAAFYSNSGGQTANSEDVWANELPYLRSVDDPFSKGMPNSEWRKTLSKSAWLNYLAENFQYPIDNDGLRYLALNFKQETRKAFFVDPGFGIPLRDIRADWKLKSTFFDVEDMGGEVVLSGRGFGHGVGLSQEGAMNMVKQGYSYDQVIRYYFTEIEIIAYDLYRFYVAERTEY